MLVLVDLTKNILGIYIYVPLVPWIFYSAIVDFIFIFSFSLFQLNTI